LVGNEGRTILLGFLADTPPAAHGQKLFENIFALLTPPSDTTPPVITPTITGNLGNNDWYTSNVTLTWSVVDSESAITSQTGCDAVNITADQAATNYTCTATSAGGTSSETVTIKRDATAPEIGDEGPTTLANAHGWYNSAVLNKFSASDALSGLADPAKASFTVSTGTAEGAAVKVSSGTVSDAAGM
jgi:hypothetical protein